jgi:acyl-CoA dehydrogenase
MTETLARRNTEADVLSAIIIEQADRLFRGEITKERMAQADRGEWPSAIWEAIEQAGLALALVPEALGGVGLLPADAFRLIRRSGYHTLPVPLAETMIAASLWSQVSGAAVSGTLSLAPTSVADAIGIERSADGYVLHGQAQRVPWGTQVGHVLVYARDQTGCGHLALLPRGAAPAQPHRNLANEPRDTLLLDAITVPKAAVRPAPPACTEGLMTFGALIRAQQMVGAMERCLDYAIAYAMERQQFGRPVGKFQAVQHMLADAAGQYAAAAAAAELAAEAYGNTDFAFAVAIAKARVGEATGKVAEVCHQVHGAMGFTQEHPLHFATRRLWSWRDEFGHETFWQERIGRLVCSAGGEALWPMLIGNETEPVSTGPESALGRNTPERKERTQP